MMTRRPLSVLIVENEFVVAQHIRILLEDIGHQVAGICKDTLEAERHLNLLPVDVVVCDIFLGTGSVNGAKWARGLRRRGIPYLLVSGGRPEIILAESDPQQVINLIYKPVRRSVLYLRLEVIDHLSPPKLHILAGAKQVVIPQSDILLIESDRNDYIVHTTGKRHIATGSLRDLMQKLDATSFLRVHRSFILNLDQVSNYTAVLAVTAGGRRVPVGRKYRPSFKAAMNDRAGESRRE